MLKSVILACVVLASTTLNAQVNPKPAKAKKVEPVKQKTVSMKITVASVTGIAHKRAAPNAKWTPLKANETLNELAIIRTGLGAKVILNLGDRGKVTVRSATKVGITEFTKTGQHVKARLGLKYGSMRAKVDRARGTSDFSVATPVATLSVRGTEGDIWLWWDLGMFLYGLENIWNFNSSYNGKNRNVSKGEWTNTKGTRSVLLAGFWRYTPLGGAGLTQTDWQYLWRHGQGRGLFNILGGGSNTVWFPEKSEDSHSNGFHDEEEGKKFVSEQ